jgi:hypothetical protein
MVPEETKTCQFCSEEITGEFHQCKGLGRAVFTDPEQDAKHVASMSAPDVKIKKVKEASAKAPKSAGKKPVAPKEPKGSVKKAAKKGKK